jgi:hypothetical protein
MLRLYLCLALLGLMAGCADPSGPFTVTVMKQGVGIVVSDPPGITCGSCAGDPNIHCPSPEPSTACSYAFAAGTTVAFTITEQEVYAGFLCDYAPKTVVPLASPAGCTFVVTRDTAVTVGGSEAFR